MEDENTVWLIKKITSELSFIAAYKYIGQVFFRAEEGILYNEGNAFDCLLKILPYEFICTYEPELAELLTEVFSRKRCILLNHSPLLYATFSIKDNKENTLGFISRQSFTSGDRCCASQRKKCVERRTFSREGNSSAKDGKYDSCSKIYQLWAELAADEEGRLCQAGVFLPYEACGLGFCLEKGIIHNHSQFSGNYVVK